MGIRTLDTIVVQGDQVSHIGANPQLDYFSGPVLVASGITAGDIINMWINKAPEGSNLPFPAAVVADGHTFEIGIRGKNTGNLTFIAGMEVTVFDPDGIQRAAPAIDWTGLDPGEELNWEYNICPVDKPGIWTTVIRFQAQE